MFSALSIGCTWPLGTQCASAWRTRRVISFAWVNRRSSPFAGTDHGNRLTPDTPVEQLVGLAARFPAGGTVALSGQSCSGLPYGRRRYPDYDCRDDVSDSLHVSGCDLCAHDLS